MSRLIKLPEGPWVDPMEVIFISATDKNNIDIHFRNGTHVRQIGKSSAKETEDMMDSWGAVLRTSGEGRL